jgi:ribonuclease HI
MENALNDIIALYADGGLIGANPSEVGGVWAWCGVNRNGERVIERGGVVPANGRPITNNHTEQIAITLALEAMPDGWSGAVCSDSNVALGRVFKGWKQKNLPANIAKCSAAAVARLGEIDVVLLQGHPTKADLERGIGAKRNLPVSIHNVWADKRCREEARKYLSENSSV